MNIEEGIDDDGIVEDAELETFYAPLEYITDTDEYLRVVCDDGPAFTETRIPHKLLNDAGWFKR